MGKNIDNSGDDKDTNANSDGNIICQFKHMHGIYLPCTTDEWAYTLLQLWTESRLCSTELVSAYFFSQNQPKQAKISRNDLVGHVFFNNLYRVHVFCCTPCTM